MALLLFLAPARTARAADQATSAAALPDCIESLEHWKAADTKCEARDKGRLEVITKLTSQRDEALKSAPMSTGPSAWGYVLAGVSGIGTGIACASGKTELCLSLLGVTLGSGAELVLLEW